MRALGGYGITTALTACACRLNTRDFLPHDDPGRTRRRVSTLVTDGYGQRIQHRDGFERGRSSHILGAQSAIVVANETQPVSKERS